MPAEELDGVSLTQVLQGGALPKRHEPMIWEFNGYGGIIAIREGKWKAVKNNLFEDPDSPIELYNLELDPGELNNLMEHYPGIVLEMDSIMVAATSFSSDFSFTK